VDNGVFLNEPLSKHTFYRIGGPADRLIFPKTSEDLSITLEEARAKDIRVFVMGQGSNLLVHDDGFRGWVIRMTKFNPKIKFNSELQTVETSAGIAISQLLRECALQGWGGLEFLAGIPGSVGGAVVMNAGTHLGESAQALSKVEVIRDGKLMSVEGADLKFQYRSNQFLNPGDVIISASWRIQKDSPERVKQKLDELLARRKGSQPIQFPSCGSVFKNPKLSGKQAWEIVDSLGLRGARSGQAQISEKHSNWIINLGGATAQDVRSLIDLVKTRAQNELNILLEEEVQFLTPTGLLGRESLESHRR
jgi:UDP-N-acetylmuramate dehydrogenase